MGSGLLTVPDVHTLPPGRGVVGLTLHNRDRDPLGIDIFDYALTGSVGLASRVEAYGRAVFSRVVVVPDVSQTSPALPPPPLDLVLPRGMAIPPRPYYSLYPGLPYANGRGDQSFADLVPGDFIAGVKLRAYDVRDDRPGLALTAEVTLPLTQRLNALQSGSGTGGIDVSLRAIAQWRVASFDLVASAGYTRVGQPSLSDHIVIADRTAAEVTPEALELPNRLELSFGARRALSSRFAVMVETVAGLELAGGTQYLDATPPQDVMLGLQTRAGRVRITSGLLYHGRALGREQVRESPLAGWVDLSRVSETDAHDYLRRIGLGGAVPHTRPGVQLVVPPSGFAMPAGARRIPDTYTLFSEHQLGFLFLLGWAF